MLGISFFFAISCLCAVDSFRVIESLIIKSHSLKRSTLSLKNKNNLIDNEEKTNKERNIPWRLQVPDYLDGSLAGDLGFDPLRIAQNSEKLFTLREAEMKHCRLAMLASVGWPISELVHYQLSQYIGLDNLLGENMRAPSVLNGGLNNVFVLFALGLFFAVGATLEFELLKKKADLERSTPPELLNFFDMWREDGWDTPGNYGFDPLGLGNYLSGNDPSRKLMLQTIEIFNGRVAMLATLGFVIQEAYTGQPVVSETPEFFQPFFVHFINTHT